jgi:molybdate transport system regulatory protein
MVSGRLHSSSLQIKGRLWIERQKQTYRSWSWIVLLERIGELGPVSAGDKLMQMSSVADCLRYECLSSGAPGDQTGRRSPKGGTWLTEAGKQAIHYFWRLVERFRGWVEHRQF